MKIIENNDRRGTGEGQSLTNKLIIFFSSIKKMKVEVRKLPKCQAELEVSISAKEFDGFLDKAILSLGKELEVEGFRKGKAPKEIIEQKVNPEKILYTAANLAVRESYPQALSENKLEVISEPEVSVLKIARGNPFIFKAKVFVWPETKLPDYQKIASEVKRNKVEVKEKEVKDTIEWLRKNYSKQKEKAPRDDNEWTKTLGNFKEFAELEKSIQEGIRLEKEAGEQKRIRQEILDKIAQNSQVEIPDILIEKEKSQMLENVKKGVDQLLKISFEDYLKKIKKTEKELLDSFFSEAERRVKNSFILKEISRQEKIDVLPEELEKKINKLLKGHENVEKDERELDPQALKLYIKEAIKNEKTFAKLESFTKNDK